LVKILVSLAWAGALIPGMVLLAIAAVVGARLGVRYIFIPAALVAGLAIFLWAFAALGQSSQACLIERLDVMESLRRSGRLTKGQRLKILALDALVLAFSAGAFFLAITAYTYAFTERAGVIAWLSQINSGVEKFGSGYLSIVAADHLRAPLAALLGLSWYLTALFWNLMGGAIYSELNFADKDKDLEEMSRVFR
jgi:hypothetical protein